MGYGRSAALRRPIIEKQGNYPRTRIKVSNPILTQIIEEAAAISVKEIKQFLSTHFLVEHVTLACADDRSYQQYQQAVEGLFGSTANYLEQVIPKHSTVTV